MAAAQQVGRCDNQLATKDVPRVVRKFGIGEIGTSATVVIDLASPPLFLRWMTVRLLAAAVPTATIPICKRLRRRKERGRRCTAMAAADVRGRHRTRMTTTMRTTTIQQSNRIHAMRGGGGATTGDAMRGNVATSCSKRDANKIKRKTGKQEAITSRRERRRQSDERRRRRRQQQWQRPATAGAGDN